MLCPPVPKVCVVLPLLMVLMLSACGCNGGSEPDAQPAVQQFLRAQELLSSGDQAGALDAFSASIEADPTAWAYLGRSKLYLEQGQDAAAIADCEAGLALEPANADLQWLLGEAKKPSGERFKGKFKNPPSDLK
ncbi:hypothetical protein [Aeoliella sp.]|uniref:hypothetical protein n=1 Tax=Aeoliella sp. TaxID=2795800 RepID=UPI003CCB83EC